VVLGGRLDLMILESFPTYDSMIRCYNHSVGTGHYNNECKIIPRKKSNLSFANLFIFFLFPNPVHLLKNFRR